MPKTKKDPALETLKSGLGIGKKLGNRLSDNLKTMKENQSIRKIEKRYEVEQYILAKLPYGQAVKYRKILDSIDFNFDILENTESTAEEKAKARGRIKALRKVRNEIEEPHTKKSRAAKAKQQKSEQRKSEQQEKPNEKNQKSNDMFGELGQLFEPYNENHHR